MKPTDPDSELRTALRPWTGQTEMVIERRLEDARQFAASGKLHTADIRIRELRHALHYVISEARARFYRQSFQQHARAGLDPDIHQLGLGPDHEGEAAAREVPILGQSPYAEISDAIEDAKASLTSAALADQNGGSFLQSWADQTRDRLTSLTARQLSDSQIAIFEAVGQILIKPELR